MECDTNFSQEYLEIFTAKVLLRRISDLLQHLTASNTGLCVDTCKREIVVTWLEVVSLLLGKLKRQPAEYGYLL